MINLLDSAIHLRNNEECSECVIFLWHDDITSVDRTYWLVLLVQWLIWKFYLCLYVLYLIFAFFIYFYLFLFIFKYILFSYSKYRQDRENSNSVHLIGKLRKPKNDRECDLLTRIFLSNMLTCKFKVVSCILLF